jgi:methylphosphotriester-DNA--protein-cysteine methyltransferase
MEVVAATLNATEPWGTRPYHRTDCWYVTRVGHVDGNWTPYPSAAAARADNRQPCQRCQPAD